VRQAEEDSSVELSRLKFQTTAFIIIDLMPSGRSGAAWHTNRNWALWVV